MEQLEERREPGRDDRVEHDLCPTGDDPLDGLTVVGVIEREVLLPDDRPTLARDDFTDLLVQRVRPDVVG